MGKARCSPCRLRPCASEARAVCEALAALHGRPSASDASRSAGCELTEPHSVLDSLVRTMLSQNTTDVTSARAFASLKAAFPSWDAVRAAPPGALEASIRVGGLADIKAARIRAILDDLAATRAGLCLEHLRELSEEDAKAALRRYKGVGPKTVACVLMFCLRRPEFPVDTHVWHIAKTLGWVAPATSREAAYEQLNAAVPDELKYDLHVLLVEHGKRCSACGKRRRGCRRDEPPCPLVPFRHTRGGGKPDSAAECGNACDVSETSSSAEGRRAGSRCGHADGGATPRRAGARRVKLEDAAVKREPGAAGEVEQVAAAAVKQEQREQQEQQQLPPAACAPTDHYVKREPAC